MKNAVFLDDAPCGSSITVLLGTVLQLLVTTNAVPSSPTLFILIMEGICSSGKSFLTRDTLCNIPEGGILQSHSRENLKSYIVLTYCAL
jgi:hypothetical protein